MGKAGRQRAAELEIINLGLIGAAPEQYLRVLEAFGLGLSPKLALFVLFPANDLTDNDRFRRWLGGPARAFPTRSGEMTRRTWA